MFLQARNHVIVDRASKTEEDLITRIKKAVTMTPEEEKKFHERMKDKFLVKEK